MKWFLIREFALTRFLPWLSEQEVWESLLVDAFNGVRFGTGPNKRGTHLTMSLPATEAYPLAIPLVEAWRAAGSPIAPTTTTTHA